MNERGTRDLKGEGEGASGFDSLKHAEAFHSAFGDDERPETFEVTDEEVSSEPPKMLNGDSKPPEGYNFQI